MEIYLFLVKKSILGKLMIDLRIDEMLGNMNIYDSDFKFINIKSAKSDSFIWLFTLEVLVLIL